MQCEKCGKDYPSRYYFKTETVCNDCFEKFTSEEKNQVMKTDISKPTSLISETKPVESYKFKTLLGYGKFISGLGWVVCIAGIALIITSFFYLSEGGYDAQLGLMQLGGGALGVLAGFSNIIFGQLISCFVAIEKNTRTTYEMLKAK